MTAVDKIKTMFQDSTNQKLMIGICLFVWAWIFIFAFLIYKPKYVSHSLVIVKDSATNTRYVVNDPNYGADPISSKASNPVLNTMGLLKSESIANTVFGDLKLKHPEELEKLNIKTDLDWLKFYGNGARFVKSKNVPGTDLIAIDFQWKSPEVAKSGLESVIRGFQAASQDINQAEQKRRSEYLDEQVNDILVKLDAVRQRKSSLKQSAEIPNIQQEMTNMTDARISTQRQLNDTIARARGAEAELNRYQSTLGMNSTQAVRASAVGLNPNIQKLHDELNAQSEKAAFLKGTLTAKNPKVREVETQIAQIKTDLQGEVNRTIGGHVNYEKQVSVADPTRGSVISQMVLTNAQVQSLHQQAASLRNELSRMNKRMRHLPNIEEAITNIEQEERNLSQALDTLEAKSLEAHIKEAETLSNIFVVDPPTLPLGPGFPSRTHVLIIGLALGVFAALAAMLLRVKFSDRADEWLSWLQVNFEEMAQRGRLQRTKSILGYTSYITPKFKYKLY